MVYAGSMNFITIERRTAMCDARTFKVPRPRLSTFSNCLFYSLSFDCLTSLLPDTLNHRDQRSRICARLSTSANHSTELQWRIASEETPLSWQKRSGRRSTSLLTTFAHLATSRNPRANFQISIQTARATTASIHAQPASSYGSPSTSRTTKLSPPATTKSSSASRARSALCLC